MTTAHRLGAFLRPTILVVAAYAVFWAVRAWGILHRAEPAADFVRPGAITAEQLPDVGLDQLVRPMPEMSPADVVKTQLAGLSDPKADGLGVLQCFLFASPANRAVTGPLDRFAEMVRREPFACFARPHATLVGEPKIEGSLARLLVTVMDENRRLLAFTFILSRQTDNPFENCWMTEAVLPVGGLAQPAAPNENAVDDSV